MQKLDINNPGVPDLQFVLMVVALTTSDLPSLNLPNPLRRMVFDRCWSLVHDTPPPTDNAQRVLDLRYGDDTTLEALVEMIQKTLNQESITHLTWDESPTESTQSTSTDAQPLVERLQQWNPVNRDPLDEPPQSSNN